MSGESRLPWAGVFVGLGALAIALLQTPAVLATSHFRWHALAWWLCLVAGGACLVAFTLGNAAADRRHLHSASKRAVFRPGVETGLRVAGLLAWAAAAAGVLWHEGAGPWTHLGLRAPATWGLPGLVRYDATLATLLLGSSLVAVGTACVGAALGGSWFALRWVGVPRRVARFGTSVLAGIGAIPFFVPLLAARIGYRGPALAAGVEAIGDHVSAPQALVAGGGLWPGLLVTAVVLGVRGGAGLWRLLDGIEDQADHTDGSRVARVGGWSHTAIVQRRLAWHRHRHQLVDVLVQAAASAVLVDLLANNLIDIFSERTPLFPLYPSLGAVTYLQLYQSPQMLSAVLGLHICVAAGALLLLLPYRSDRTSKVALWKDRTVRRADQIVLSRVPSAERHASFPFVDWVLGLSGAGKSTLLTAMSTALPNRTVIVPQDPDLAVPRDVPVALVARWAVGDSVDAVGRLETYLLRLGDADLVGALQDVYRSAGVLSRGQRQRLAFAITIAALDPSDANLLLDEVTSAQDPQRTHRMMKLLRTWCARRADRAGSCWTCTHDPTVLRAAMKGRDQVHFVRDGGVTAGSAAAFMKPEGGESVRDRYVASLRDLGGRDDIAEVAASGRGLVAIQLGTRVLGRGAWELHLPAETLHVPASSVVLMEGPSGGGKSLLLQALIDACNGHATIGWVPQDPARAHPMSMPCLEAIGPELLDGLGSFGEALGPAFDDLEPSVVRGRRFGELSEGQRQRLVFAHEMIRVGRQATADRPGLLVLDEPFGSADPIGHLELLETVCTWVADHPHRSVLMVSHHGAAVRRMSAKHNLFTQRWSIRCA